ncbi:UDP-N-acetylglucosamine--N-acetylmuramyl-(pentapeptide) pyrophosphoryl-undecaprenol N-acetylglucosamine transferase [Arthrobacter sp. SO3]|uniref:UDP-N-acetylglucosamine--N-acetylmuramyl- (pentapeptide) pyrophosphoryl-undecaprenol N-acetylglucosamine transferase n=1 Tax=Arthrobacter sp. SO3 TaxID=1897057 RepID=UPI001CFFD1C5|nr:UDP-N-acetylglucosamine--N-acetylmuramyl-(pentapeptide) pyrophosphoryl-undecaprenol N-acetylglucosamine transferase [Arthrobacter sp. SO3]MCB5294388.1 UDP-N-acetylglucosamine--N-acetylmuramyl-(pentapeptide) pyrophosphoryl-undecaprenol N-acetylglucosamine transferase [Arthrobacter sp. SO3]
MTQTLLPPHPGSRVSGRPLRVVIGAGGTGGHIYPGIAVADAIRRRIPDAIITFSGTTRGLEGRLVPEAGYRLDTVTMIPFAKQAGLRRFALPAYLLASALRVAAMLRREEVDVVIGMGGYPSMPAVLAARFAKRPCIIHESNAVPGLANRVAARIAGQVGLGLPNAEWILPPGVDGRVVGIPVSESIARADRDGLGALARAHFGLRDDQRLVVISGGSQGAATLTRAALGVAALWCSRGDIRLLIKARPEEMDDARRQLEASGGHRIATVVEYIDRMDYAYAAADVVVTRAGSATIAELDILDLPAVLVPYPHAPGDHQSHNARALAQGGRAIVISDAALTAATLQAALTDRLTAPPAAPAASAHSTAADTVADWAISLAPSTQRTTS